MERADLGPVPLHSGVRVEEVARGRGRELVATAWLKGQSWVLVGRQRVPRPSLLLLAHPAVSTVFVAGLIGVVLLSFLVARARLRQFRALEAERASLYASVAQAQKMAAIGRMAASIAHEINSPLANIGAQVGVVGDLVKEHPALPSGEELRSRIQKIEAQLERGRKITHRLLGFSRRVGPELEPVNVAAALDETVGLLEKELEAEQIEVQRDYDRELPTVESSLAQMQQVFLNLINHAVDAVGGEGQLWLMVRPHEGGVQVKIAHSGKGLPPEAQRHALDGVAAGEPGLGLAICREMMAALDGRIELERAAERTTFSLWFPLRRR
jgi:two-component system NtrC family sensor kinase